MIPGIVAATLPRGEVSPGEEMPEWVPAGALFHLDFVNQRYWVVNNTYALGSIATGIDVSPNSYGLAVTQATTQNNLTPVGALYDILADMFLGGGTFVLECYRATGSPVIPDGDILWWFDTPDPDDLTDSANLEITQFPFVPSYGDSETSFDGTVALTNTGAQVVGSTINEDIGGGDYRTSHSVNGAAAESGTHSPRSSLVPAGIRLFGIEEFANGLDDTTVRRFTGFPPQSPGMLPSLVEQIAWVPGGALVHLDFTTQRYWAYGGERALGDLVTGVDVAPDGDGLAVDTAGQNHLKAKDDFFDQLVALFDVPITVILECEKGAGGVNDPDRINGTFLTWFDTSSSSGFSEAAQFGVDIATFSAVFVAGPGVSHAGTDMVGTTGRQVVGITAHEDVAGQFRHASSVNGAAAETTTNAGRVSFTPLSVYLFGDDGASGALDAVNVRRLTIFPAATPSTLPALAVPIT